MIIQRIGHDISDGLGIGGRSGPAAVDLVRQLGQFVRNAVGHVRSRAGTRIRSDNHSAVKLHGHNGGLCGKKGTNGESAENINPDPNLVAFGTRGTFVSILTPVLW